jgi:hypothetical protein
MKKFIFTILLGGLSLLASAQDVPDSSSQPMQRVFKINPFGLLTTKLTLGYEQRVNERLNMDVDLGIIGINLINQTDNNARGLFVKFGPRFYANHCNDKDDWKHKSGFHGAYLMPTLAFTHYRHDGLTDDIDFIRPGTINAPTIALYVGHQMVIGGAVTFDINAGVGHGLYDNYDFIFHHSHMGNRLIGSFTLGMGVLTK